MEGAEQNELIFIYNADSGLFNSVSDYFHKIISPQTYTCSLCQITYGNLGIKKEWKDFLDELPLRKTFLHKDELERTNIVASNQLPAILIKSEKQPAAVLISAEELNSIKNLVELKSLVLSGLESKDFDID